ncbi:MAG: serine hydrolase [Caldilineaceae bacterium]|nr:serine hydrolase [Caldilineaceae bacterium]
MSNKNRFPHSTPEAQNVPASAIENFLDGIKRSRLELHSLMLLRHGRLIAQGWWKPYSPNRIHLLYSLSKSFTSTAVGLAVNEGRLTVNDRVIDFFPDELPEQISDNLAAMEVRHLLCMGTGHAADTAPAMFTRAGDNWIKGVLSIPPEEPPGSVFAYNQGATFLLAAIVQKLTGGTLVEYLEPRLFTPLGIDQYFWQQNPQGINFGYSGLHLTTDAIARLGQLYLQQGVWMGEQLLPTDWVAAASSRQIDSSTPNTEGGESQNPDWIQGYGYQFWRCRHNAYRGDGAFGQFCLIMPDQDAVLAMTAGTNDMQGVLDQVWDHLLPAFGDEAPPQAPGLQSQLEDRLSTLAYPPVAGQSTSPVAADVLGNAYQLHAADDADEGGTAMQIGAFKLTTAEDGYWLHLTTDNGEHALRLGYQQWSPGVTTLINLGDDPIRNTVGSYAWIDDNKLTAAVRFIETPHALTVKLRFVDDQAELSGYWNAVFGPVELPVMLDRRVE